MENNRGAYQGTAFLIREMGKRGILWREWEANTEGGRRRLKRYNTINIQIQVI